MMTKGTELPVRAEADVVVAGGGLGGVSAAVAAARAGARTVLVERNGYVGGVATAGLCCSVFNCLYTADRQLVVRGNPLEFVEALATAQGYGRKWHQHKGHIIYDVEIGKLVLQDLLDRAGVMCLFDTTISGVIVEEDQVRGLRVVSKSGEEMIMAGCVVDATGDADVAFLAGAPLHEAEDKVKARHSLCFRLGNVDVAEFVQYFREHPEEYPPHMDVDWDGTEACRQFDETGTFLFPHGGGQQLSLITKGVAAGTFHRVFGVYDNVDALQMHAIGPLGVVNVVTGYVELGQLDIGQISRAMADGRRMAHHVADYFRNYVPGFAHTYVAATADDLGIRVSRWNAGEFVFTKAMMDSASRFADAVGRGVVQRNHRKNPSPGAWSVQEMTNAYFELPYRCLLPRNVEGLIMGAGRSVSAESPFLLRVMVHTMIVGQGAGVAAALAVQHQTTPRLLEIAALQRELTRQGVWLGD